MRVLTVFACLCALAAAGCAGGGLQPRSGISLFEARSLCNTFLTGSMEEGGPTCGGAAHHDVCDTYMDPLPDMTDRARCLAHCQEAWETLIHRYAGKECAPQIARGKDFCRQYCMGLP